MCLFFCAESFLKSTYRGVFKAVTSLDLKTGHFLRHWRILLPILIIAVLLHSFLVRAMSIRSRVSGESSSAQLTWAKPYGGTDQDEGWYVQQTSDGGYIAVGETWSSGAGWNDVFVVKADAQGNVQWTKTYGGPDSDFGYSIQQTSDKGYIIVGGTMSSGAGSSDVYLIKVDTKGSTQWSRTYGGPNAEIGYAVQQTTDGGYVIVGETSSFGAGNKDIYLIKTDSKGKVQWTRTYGGPKDDSGKSVRQTSDGGYIIAGYTESFGNGDMDGYLVKTDEKGQVQWSRTYGGRNLDVASSLEQTKDLGYVVVGGTILSDGGSYDVYLIKTDANGQIQWSKTYGGSGADWGNSVKQTSDEGYVIAGWTTSGHGGMDFYLVKTDAKGEIQWAKTYGGPKDDSARCVQRTSDGGYVIIGYTESLGAGKRDLYMIKADSNGDFEN